MAQKISALGALMATNAANVATQMGGGTTTAEVQDLAKMIVVVGARSDISDMAIGLCWPSTPNNLLPG